MIMCTDKIPSTMASALSQGICKMLSRVLRACIYLQVSAALLCWPSTDIESPFASPTIMPGELPIHLR